jgi:hypothetical protein
MMIETKASGFNWRLPAWGGVSAVAVTLPMLLCGNNLGAFLGTIPLFALVGLGVIVTVVRNLRRQALAALTMLCIFAGLAWLLFRSSDDLRTRTRWLAHSQAYKDQVLTQSTPADGSLKHEEWDGWGGPGAGDTTVYLVSDPTDRLAAPARAHLSGKFEGIPCSVVRVDRLEKSWYTVLFYTDTAWNFCG